MAGAGRGGSSGEGEPTSLVKWSDPFSWHVGWTAVLVPNGVMMYNHARGRSPAFFSFVIKHFGYYGLFVTPFVALAMEKSFYDTSLCLRGIDPNKRADDRQGEGFPSGGHALPSLSLVPLRENGFTLGDILPSSLSPFDTTRPQR